MRGDALASGAGSARFQTNTEKKLTDKEYVEKVGGNREPEHPAVFCGCNAKGCEEFVAYSATEFSDHFHLVHGQAA